MSTRILIAEDEAMIASLLSEMLVGMGYEVCGLVNSQEALLKAGVETKPDLMLVDVGLRSGSGVIAVKQITDILGYIPHIFITGDSKSAESLRPVATVLQKPFRSSDLAESIKNVQLNDLTKKELESWPQLTFRQRQVLLFLAQGKSNLQISEALQVAESTIKVYVSQVIRLLKVENRTQAALLVAKSSMNSTQAETEANQARILLENLLDLVFKLNPSLEDSEDLPIEILAVESFLKKNN